MNKEDIVFLLFTIIFAPIALGVAMTILAATLCFLSNLFELGVQ